jgi:phosphoglycerate dehydrogenase-like enzyme
MRVAVLDDYQGRAGELAAWDSLAAEVSFFREPIPSEELPFALRDFNVLVLMRERTAFPRALLEQLPDLKLLITTGRRNASVDDDYLRGRGVVYCGTDGTGARSAVGGVPSTVEVAWALIFATAKRVVIEDRALRAGRWQLGLPANLAGTTLGLLGFGRLGAAMVGPARAFGRDVVAWSPNLDSDRAAQAGAALGVAETTDAAAVAEPPQVVTRDQLFARSDFLSIHLVLGDRSRGSVGALELAAMKHTAVLINTSRGPIVDEAALIDALAMGRIAAAGLDVYDTEPLPADHPLLGLENNVLTPHLGYVSEASMRTMYGEVVEDIAAYIDGSPVRVIQ